MSEEPTTQSDGQAPKGYASRVHSVLLDCLFLPEEIVGGKPPADAVLVEGIVNNFGFHKGRLEGHRAEVQALLREILHDNFHEDKGGGWSFLQMAAARDGSIWGEHRSCQDLLVLAIGLGMAKYAMEREMWPLLPGGVPYVIFNLTPA